MKYFLHDSSSFDDEKITELYINFGYEGLGLFYTILEKLAKQEKPIKTDVLKHQLKVGKRLNKCWKFMEEIDLISSNNGETFNKQLLNFSEKYQIKKEKNAKRIYEWRRNQQDSKNVTHYESVRNSSKVKESKVNEIKENNSSIMYNSATAIMKLLNSIPKEKIDEMKELTLFNGNLKELKEKFAVEFIGRYGLNKTAPEVIETFQSWMHRDKTFKKEETPKRLKLSEFKKP